MLKKHVQYRVHGACQRQPKKSAHARKKMRRGRNRTRAAAIENWATNQLSSQILMFE
jgi:hypothetical protein